MPIFMAVRILKGALVALAAVYLVNFFLLAFLIGPFDYDHLSGYYELAWRFWRAAPGWPGFNPFLCGGRTLGGDPQLPLFHPFVLLVPLLGPTVVIKWEMLLQLGLGLWGLSGCLRRVGVSSEGWGWGLFVYAAGGAVITRFMVGHFTLGFYFLYPLFLSLSYRLSDPDCHFRLRVAYWTLFLYSSLYKPNFLIYGVPPLLVECAFRAG
jgi:hypothetical protein